MRIIPVISLNVIRQAIAWHDVTQPVELRVASNFDFPDGRRQTSVYANFNVAQLIDDCGLSNFREPSRYAFMYRLQECFCADIRVVNCSWDPADDECVVTLSCTIEKHDHE